MKSETDLIVHVRKKSGELYCLSSFNGLYISVSILIILNSCLFETYTCVCTYTCVIRLSLKIPLLLHL